MINSATYNQITERDNKYQGHQNKRQSRSNEPTSFPSSLGAQRVAHGGTTSAGPAYPYENRDLKQTMRHQSNKFQILEQSGLSHLRRIAMLEKVRFQLLSTLCGLGTGSNRTVFAKLSPSFPSTAFDYPHSLAPIFRFVLIWPFGIEVKLQATCFIKVRWGTSIKSACWK